MKFYVSLSPIGLDYKLYFVKRRQKRVSDTYAISKMLKKKQIFGRMVSDTCAVSKMSKKIRIFAEGVSDT